MKVSLSGYCDSGVSMVQSNSSEEMSKGDEYLLNLFLTDEESRTLLFGTKAQR